MGYYQGSGIVTSKSSTGSSAGAFTEHSGASVFLARRTNITVTKYPGVQLPKSIPAAQYDMQAMIFPDYRINIGLGGGETWNTPHAVGDYNGNKTDYSFSQIGNSNLYEKVETREEVTTWINRNYRVYS